MEGTQEQYYFLYDTMCGHNSLRDLFDGGPTEMQKLLGSTDEEENGNDYNVDFLFGFAGYDYSKLTDMSTFKEAIIASIDAGDAGNPVIAKISGRKEPGRYRILTGYDGEKILEPDYQDICHMLQRSGCQTVKAKQFSL